MRLPPRLELSPDSLHCLQCNSRFQIKHVSSFDFLDGTPESPQEHPNKSQMTLMSPKECEMVQCIPHQLEIILDPLYWI